MTITATDESRFSQQSLDLAKELLTPSGKESAEVEDIMRVARAVYLNAAAQLEAAFDDRLDARPVRLLAYALQVYALKLDDFDTAEGAASVTLTTAGAMAARKHVCAVAFFETLLRLMPKAAALHGDLTGCQRTMSIDLQSNYEPTDACLAVVPEPVDESNEPTEPTAPPAVAHGPHAHAEVEST